MISTWVLVIFFKGHHLGGVTSIEGFSSYGTCLQAGMDMEKEYEQKRGTLDLIKYLCVEKK